MRSGRPRLDVEFLGEPKSPELIVYEPTPLSLEIADLLKRRGYERREQPFTLTSGAVSHDYIDGKLAIAEGAVLRRIGEAVVEVVGQPFELVGGLTMGADPLAHAVSIVSGAQWFSVRKAAKGHGTEAFLEGGRLTAGARVVLVDDVVTTGGSTLIALERIRAAQPDVDVIAAVALCDRGDTAGAALAAAGVAWLPLTTYREMGIDPVLPVS
jgi:orotate phosphoribosyltransferase